MELQAKKPRYQYDCIFCKFNWNCGPACRCEYRRRKALPEPPKEVKNWVNNSLKSAGYEPEFI